jgi:hypothetical protein
MATTTTTTTATAAHTGVGPLTPLEVSFLAENEMITIVPRQRLEGLDLISVRAPSRAANDEC